MNKTNFKGRTILAVGAHPDDTDFSSSGTIARAVKEGAEVHYLIATDGQKGSDDKKMTSAKLGQIRQREQTQAAKVLGVKAVHFLGYIDGELQPTLELKAKIVRAIREIKPDIVFALDPSRFYFKERGFIQHADHRATGEATLDAVYPLARDRLSFPVHEKAGLRPHKVNELLISAMGGEDANYYVDITDTIEIKIKALSKHRSQIGNIKELGKRMRMWASVIGQRAGMPYAEAFVRLKLPE